MGRDLLDKWAGIAASTNPAHLVAPFRARQWCSSVQLLSLARLSDRMGLVVRKRLFVEALGEAAWSRFRAASGPGSIIESAMAERPLL